MNEYRIKLPPNPNDVFSYEHLSYEELIERYPTMPDTLRIAAGFRRELCAMGRQDIAEAYRHAIIHLISLRLDLDGIELPVPPQVLAMMKAVEDYKKSGGHEMERGP